MVKYCLWCMVLAGYQNCWRSKKFLHFYTTSKGKAEKYTTLNISVGETLGLHLPGYTWLMNEASPGQARCTHWYMVWARLAGCTTSSSLARSGLSWDQHCPPRSCTRSCGGCISTLQDSSARPAARRRRQVGQYSRQESSCLLSTSSLSLTMTNPRPKHTTRQIRIN